MRRFAVTFFVFLVFFSLMGGASRAREASLDFYDFPREIAELFRAHLSDFQKELRTLSGAPVQLFIFYDGAKDEYKATLIMGLEPRVFGVDERRVSRDKLDLRPFATYFLTLDSYRSEVRKSAPDPGQRKIISQILMSVMLVNTRGDRFEFYGDTDFFMGVREAVISPNFIFERKDKKPFTIYMEPTAVVSQVFILPPARDEKRRLTEASLVYDFFSFQY
jgi:hypothetical protein